MSYKLVYKDRGFIIAFFGTVSIDELNRGNGEIHGHSEFDNHRYQLVDFRQADLSAVSFDDAHETAAIDLISSSTNPAVRLALVVAADEYTFKICQAFAQKSIAFGSPWEYRIFQDFENARAWATEKLKQ